MRKGTLAMSESWMSTCIAVIALVYVTGCSRTAGRGQTDPSGILRTLGLADAAVSGKPQSVTFVSHDWPAVPRAETELVDCWRKRQIAGVIRYERLIVANNMMNEVVAAAKIIDTEHIVTTSEAAADIQIGSDGQLLESILGKPTGAQAYKDIVTRAQTLDTMRAWAIEPPLAVHWYGSVRIIIGEDGKVTEVSEPAQSLLDFLTARLPASPEPPE